MAFSVPLSGAHSIAEITLHIAAWNLEKLRPADLARTVPGHKFSLGFMIAGASQHALYHAGQISMLKKAVLRQAGVLLI